MSQKQTGGGAERVSSNLEPIPAIPILQLPSVCNAVVAVTSPPHQNQ